MAYLTFVYSEQEVPLPGGSLAAVSTVTDDDPMTFMAIAINLSKSLHRLVKVRRRMRKEASERAKAEYGRVVRERARNNELDRAKAVQERPAEEAASVSVLYRAAE